jgi:tripartite-type tricarboxylate transporter receptor subunit TctC
VIRRRIEDIGQDIYPASMQTPAALTAFQNAEIDKWTPILKEAGIKAQ